MSLHLYSSNSLANLAEKLSEDLRTEKVSVFQPYYIITQTEGMNNWLKLQIAKYNGIAANCIFLKPNDLIHHIYKILGGRNPNQLSSNNLCWLIYSILGEKEFNNKYRNIADYYSSDNPDKDIKRLALAEKITDLFDQYQVYRTEMIMEWNNQTSGTTDKSEWQQFLWKKAKELSGDKLPDKTVLREYIKNMLKDSKNAEKLTTKIPFIHLFGLSVTTNYHLHIFNVLAEHTNINYYLQNPAPSYYWFEDKSEKQLAILSKKGLIDKVESGRGNNLLSNWGRVISDTFSLFFQNEHLLNVYEEIGISEPVPDNLLHKIQSDIFNNAVNENRNQITIEDISDGSVTINSCFTIAREVEVLYNYLVHLVDNKKENLSPGDIVVMVTDIDSYAPYIRAVFSNAPYRFKFSIADESFNVGDSMINALKSILTMNSQNFKAEEVLQLLDSAFIRNRFGLSNISLIRNVVGKANIRFGMEGREEDETVYVSWSYGISRIMYGICMIGDDAYNTGDQSIYPLDAVEGADALEMIRFTHFVQVLMDSIKERKYERTIAEWVQYIEKVIQNLLSDTEEDVEEEYNLILSELEKLNIANEYVQEKISFEIFSHSFMNSFSSSTRAGSFSRGGITFCSLIPMRSIPFKIVAMIGLNFDKFPRRENGLSFNLMEKKRMKGDRNVKDNDKHLFLETLISALQYIYISYIGQNVKDNTTLPPSALLDELIDYIETGCPTPETVRKTLIKQHPLHSFSFKYNNGDPDFYDYLNNKTAILHQLKAPSKELRTVDNSEVSISQIISFFKHPVKVYYNRILNIKYEDEDILLADTELFELDNLQKWRMKQNLVLSKEEAIPQMKEKMVKTGELPLKNMALLTIDEIENEAKEIRKLLKDCIGELQQNNLPIDLQIGETNLTGQLSNCYGDKLVYISYSKNEYKQLLESYIAYLAARAQGSNISLFIISVERKEMIEAQNLTQKAALSSITAIMNLYKEGLKNILLFHPSFKIEPKNVESLEKEQFDKIVNNLFSNFNNSFDDRYLLNEYKNGLFTSETAFMHFRTNCKLLVEPLMEVFPGYFN